jgi:xanthine dehydrogenase accessory factor
MRELLDILKQAHTCQQQGIRCAIATVVKTEGSVYRKLGARLLLCETGEMVGAISGGCLEGDLFNRAQDLFYGEAAPQLVTYDHRSPEDLVWGLGLGCNGAVQVLLEPVSASLSPSHLAFVERCLGSQRAGVMVTVLQGNGQLHLGDRLWFHPDGSLSSSFDLGKIPVGLLDQLLHHPALQRPIPQSARNTTLRFANDRSSQPLTDGSNPDPKTVLELSIEVIHPQIHLVIWGGGTDAVPLVNFAHQLGWRTTVVDHRPGFAAPHRFPQADQVLWHEDLSHIPKLAATAGVIMTHHYPSDLALLPQLLALNLPYLGLLGPKHRAHRLLADLAQQDIFPNPYQWQQLHTPIGLDIGANSPDTIALAIVAEIQMVLAQGSGQKLCDRPTPTTAHRP